MVVYCNNSVYAKKFIIPVTDNKEDAAIEVYVLTNDMSSLELMKAFRACRINPMKSWYYIPPEPKEFFDYAYDAVHRGTLNIYRDWDVLVGALTDDVLKTTEREIYSCVRISFDNYGIHADEDVIKFVSGAVVDATGRYGAYPACKAFLRLLESGRAPTVPMYNTIMKNIITVSAHVENAVNEFRQSGSQILSILAAERIYKINIPRQEEFDRVAIHVMFRPLTPDIHDLKDRRSQIVRVAKENGR